MPTTYKFSMLILYFTPNLQCEIWGENGKFQCQYVLSPFEITYPTPIAMFYTADFCKENLVAIEFKHYKYTNAMLIHFLVKTELYLYVIFLYQYPRPKLSRVWYTYPTQTQAQKFQDARFKGTLADWPLRQLQFHAGLQDNQPINLKPLVMSSR